ncbi:MAG: ABC transporter permease [Anaerolineae bacterium]|uniref:ABC transporter permease n=1 Tax=Promineifilum sp. TaxID=2664178 RepID=UPI001DCADE73|nr:ABC transporter permease [Anaerolineales bacterium]MCB8935506.1 ABC transporter permease [Promineifilum sp.]MCO5180559.1 ABC transporter permease [Promineifilum sp.]MCW5847266.1 ABC transporter permease [Anaerolineae bacterium]
MKLIENIRIALRGLSSNKLRAALTMLGILIGVAAVITLLSLGDGVTRFVADQFSGLGTNLVFILPEQGEPGPPGSDPLTESSMTLRDAELLSDVNLVPQAEAVAPVIFRQIELQYGGNLHSVLGRASTPNYAAINNLEIARGRAIDEADYNVRSRVIVLGPETAQALFPDDIDPLDQDVRVNGINFRVIGLLTEKGAAGIGGSQDDIALIPLTTAQERLFDARSSTSGEFLVDAVLIQAADDAAIDGVIIDASEVLRQSHNVAFRDDDDFQILTQGDFIQAFGAVTGVLTLFLGAIAGISLLVGGIGIMNIMLVSVTERTREIGLRKAVGARRRDILGQFLTEAVVLALLGGVLGIIIGSLGALAINLAVPQLDTTVTLNSVALAVGFSAAVGLFFGIYPASRAAGLHPIEALRFE